jgi:hypothetical protein
MKLVGRPLTDDEAHALERVAAEAMSLNQHPSDEHEIRDWLDTIGDYVNYSATPLDHDPDAEDPTTMKRVRDNLLVVVAVAMAAIASIDASS